MLVELTYSKPDRRKKQKDWGKYLHACNNCHSEWSFLTKPCLGVRTLNNLKCPYCGLKQVVLLAPRNTTKFFYEKRIDESIRHISNPSWGLSHGRNQEQARKKQLQYLNKQRNVLFPLGEEQ